MTQQQIRWREALTNPLATSKTKLTAIAGLLGSGIPLEIIKAWAKMGASQFRVNKRKGRPRVHKAALSVIRRLLANALMLYHARSRIEIRRTP